MAWVCSICTQRSATNYCCCEGSETFLCTVCVPEHYKRPDGLHIVLKVETYGEHRKPGYFDRLTARDTQLQRRVTTLRQNLGHMDTCIERFTLKVDQLVQSIRTEAANILQYLQAERTAMEETISAAVQEAKETLQYDEVPQISELGQLLREPTVDQGKLALFHYFLPDTLTLPISNCIVFRLYYELNSVLPLFPAISKNKLTMYSLGLHKSEQFQLSRAFSDGTMYAIVGKRRVLAVGGSAPCVKQTFWLDLRNREITAGPNLQQSRGFAGITQVGAFIYAFGGCSTEKMRESEKLDLQSGWKAIGPMAKPRYAFSPCLYNVHIYLVEVREYQGAEKYSFAADSYTSLALALPCASGHGLHFLAKQDLIFLINTRKASFLSLLGTTEKQLHAYSLESALSTVNTFNCPTFRSEMLISNSEAHLLGSRVYYVQFDTGELRAFDLTSSTLS